MKSRPILFSAPMVRALLAGTKTQTRRIVKHEHANEIEAWHWNTVSWRFGVYGEGGVAADMGGMHCPYGVPGDHLWVRETWKVDSESNHEKHLYVSYRAGAVAGTGQQRHKFSIEKDADLARAAWGKGSVHSWRPSIFMPRWASRISLEVTGVRVERLNDISEADSIAEGVSAVTMPEQYETLWESINGADSWAANPWVWVVEFKRVES